MTKITLKNVDEPYIIDMVFKLSKTIHDKLQDLYRDGKLDDNTIRKVFQYELIEFVLRKMGYQNEA